jgi:DNA-binding HxlR family transcriptional regulator
MMSVENTEVTVKEEVFGRPYLQTPRGPAMEPCAPHAVLTRMGDKWTIMVVSLLSLAHGNRLRFSELQRGVKGVSQRMLTLTLRSLEKDGLVTRQTFPEVPPRVEYELTALGVSLLPALEGFTRWIKANWPTIEASRRAYELRED